MGRAVTPGEGGATPTYGVSRTPEPLHRRTRARPLPAIVAAMETTSHPGSSSARRRAVRRAARSPLLAVAAVAVLAVGCAADDPLAAEPVTTSEVAVVDNEFEPAVAEVPAGTTVTWMWEGRNDHNVVADDFSSDVQSSGTFTHTFDEPGTYAYQCTLHGGMRGEVVVIDAAP